MSSRAEMFLEDWVDQHARPSPTTDVQGEAHKLAARCLADASEEGIPREELMEAAGRDLEGYIMCFIAEAAD